MRMPSKYQQFGKVLKLNKVLYNLQRSTLLSEQKLINEIKKLGFTEIFQKLCVI